MSSATGEASDPLYVATTALSPLGAFGGTTTLNWNCPATTSPANCTVAAIPPIVIVGKAARLPVWAIEPLTTGGVVAPNPLAYSTTVSPGVAGLVLPGYRLAGPSRVLSACVAAMYGPPLNTKKDGVSAFAATGNAALVTVLRVT